MVIRGSWGGKGAPQLRALLNDPKQTKVVPVIFDKSAVGIFDFYSPAYSETIKTHSIFTFNFIIRGNYCPIYLIYK